MPLARRQVFFLGLILLDVMQVLVILSAIVPATSPDASSRGGRGRQGNVWESLLGESGLKIQQSPPLSCCTEINKDYSVEMNGGDLFWACYSWGVSSIPCVWRGLKRQTKEWASFIMKTRKASGMLWLEVVGLTGDGLTGSGVSSVIGSRSVFRFLSLALSWKQDNN